MQGVNFMGLREKVGKLEGKTLSLRVEIPPREGLENKWIISSRQFNNSLLLKGK